MNPQPSSDMIARPIPFTGDTAESVAKIMSLFARPFAADQVKLKPQMVKNNRALAIAYIDSRSVQDRLDEAVGGDCWQDEYVVLPNGSVECRLSVWLGARWITKADVGSESEQPDGGDRTKAAYSDAFKRAAVKFGIGRYLYRMKSEWMDYDPVKKCIIVPQGRQSQGVDSEVSESAKDIAKALDTVKTREEATPYYRRYEAALTAKAVTPADDAWIKAALTRFGKRLPVIKAASSST